MNKVVHGTPLKGMKALVVVKPPAARRAAR
jgi:hypothetical protein